MKFMYTPSVQCSEEGANDRRSRVQLTGEAGKPLALNDPTTSDTSCQVNMQMISTETVSFGEIRIYKGEQFIQRREIRTAPEMLKIWAD